MIARVLRRPVVLAYHGVNHVTDVDDPHHLVVSPEHLEAHIGLLRRRGYRFMTVEELAIAEAETAPPPRTAILTFDDGWLDGLTCVAPLLQRLGLRATFNVCPGMWEGQHQFVAGEAGRLLGQDDARRLAQSGMELGSHAMSHRDLRGLGDDELRDELEASKAGVEAITGRRCHTLAYPYGLFDARVERAAADAGYEVALAWLPGRWRRFAVPRMPAPPRHGAGRLAIKLLGLHRRYFRRRSDPGDTFDRNDAIGTSH
jgi:peptidoglycan/xylan/chitin deacetylase (PgdA/CDA1 family)